jgi:DNA repair protein RecO (recombination protein O)
MIVRTEAIVLRTVKYGETSLIVTLFTKRLGTIAVMAKGARGAKSKFGSSLRPMSHVQAVFYHKPSRDVHTLSECTTLTVFKRLYAELNRMAAGVRIVETISTLFPRPEVDEAVFDAALAALLDLEESNQNWANLLPYFQLQMCASLGFAPMVDPEAVRQIGSSGGFLSLEDGSISQTKPLGPSTPASRRAIRALGVLVHAGRENSLRMSLDIQSYRELVEMIESYVRYHVEDFRPSRSKVVFDRLANLDSPAKD